MANRSIRSSLVRLAAGVGVAFMASAAVPAAADVKAGVDAWSAGDYAAAIAEWQGPAQTGDADALFNLAQAYRLGRGVEADVNRARDLYAQAADKGHIKAADNYGLLLFQQGEQDRAMPLIKAAAERGDPRAQYVLGLAHFNADFAEKDWVRAYAYLTLANGAGLPQASTALAQMDQYVPLTQRQQAQSLARQLDEAAAQRRSAELAAVDLGTQQTARPAPAPVAVPAAAPAPVRVAAVSRPVEPSPQGTRERLSPPALAQTSPAARMNGNWRVQLGAFGVRGNADRLWSQLASNPALAGTQKALVPGGNVTRLQAVGFTSRAEAQSACDALKRSGQACLVAGNS
ncbi:SPOR domain-containing protein [Qipengyuania sp. ASV99]|uniref:SPOR domain-containing protein n=1 Tax=Qipengyuania sp. ASV99 TaxID=3399681 RepID=UPI003A4C505A